MIWQWWWGVWYVWWYLKRIWILSPNHRPSKGTNQIATDFSLSIMPGPDSYSSLGCLLSGYSFFLSQMVSHLVTLWKVTFRFLSKRSLLIRWHCRYLLLGRWGIPCPTWCQAISNWQKKKWTLHAIYINIPTESNVPFTSIYPLVMTNIAMEAMALIEIDGLPFLIAWWIFPWRTVSHNQMVDVLHAMTPNMSTSRHQSRRAFWLRVHIKRRVGDSHFAPESTGKRCPVPPSFFFRWWWEWESAFPKRTSIRRSTRMIAMSTVMWSWMRPQPAKFGSWRISWVVWCRRKSGVLQGWTNKPADGSIMMPGVADVFSVFPVISTRNSLNLLLLFCLF